MEVVVWYATARFCGGPVGTYICVDEKKKKERSDEMVWFLLLHATSIVE